MEDDVNVLALVRGGERYVFIYVDGREKDLLQQLGRLAANKEVSFSWYDAAVLSQRVRAKQNGAKR